MKSRLSSLLLALGVFAAASADAGVVRVWGERYNLNIINDFYDGLAGHSSAIATGTLDTVDLTGVNLLWAVQPGDAYSPAELAAMAGFLAGGGRIAFMGEHGGFAPNENARINAALSFLGSGISIQDNILVDVGFRTASVGDGQILPHPLTTGVNSYEYAAFAPLNVSGAGQVLMLGEQHPTDIMMAYENIGPGSVFLITDQNVWDHAPNWSSDDNAIMFENLLTGQTGAPVPEPGTLVLLGAGLAGLRAVRQRRKL